MSVARPFASRLRISCLTTTALRRACSALASAWAVSSATDFWAFCVFSIWRSDLTGCRSADLILRSWLFESRNPCSQGRRTSFESLVASGPHRTYAGGSQQLLATSDRSWPRSLEPNRPRLHQRFLAGRWTGVPGRSESGHPASHPGLLLWPLDQAASSRQDCAV